MGGTSGNGMAHEGQPRERASFFCNAPFVLGRRTRRFPFPVRVHKKQSKTETSRQFRPRHIAAENNTKKEMLSVHRSCSRCRWHHTLFSTFLWSTKSKLATLHTRRKNTATVSGTAQRKQKHPLAYPRKNTRCNGKHVLVTPHPFAPQFRTPVRNLFLQLVRNLYLQNASSNMGDGEKKCYKRQ